jgi:hypothetical protein
LRVADRVASTIHSLRWLTTVTLLSKFRWLQQKTTLWRSCCYCFSTRWTFEENCHQPDKPSEDVVRSCTPSRLPCSTEGDEGRFLICLSAVLPYNRSGRSLKTWPCRWSMLPNVYFLFIQFVQMFIFFSFNLSKCSWSRTEQKHENLILVIEEVGVKLQSRS